MIDGRPERDSGRRPTRVTVGITPRLRYLSMYSRPVRRTLRPWKNRLLDRRLLDRRLLPRRVARRLLARRLLPRLVERFRLEPPRLARRVRAAFLAAADRLAFLAARVRAAFFAAAERLDLRPVVLRRAEVLRAVLRRAEAFRPVVLRRAADLRADLRFRPEVAMVMPPELAVSLGLEERRRRGLLPPPESILRAAAKRACDPDPL
jgi:hypothetical protein